MSKSINFFATESDLTSVLLEFEASVDVKYVRAGMTDDPTVESFSSALEIPELSIAAYPDQNHCPRFLVMPTSAAIRVESIPQRRGGLRYAIDQRGNPSSVTLQAGGLYAESCVIAGQIGTCSGDPTSIELFQSISRLLTNTFKRLKSYFVGPKAMLLMEKGYRLTADARLSRGYDLSVT